MVELRVQFIGDVVAVREELPEHLEVIVRKHLKVPAALHDQRRLIALEQVIRGGLLPHLLEVVQRNIAGEFLLFRLVIAQFVEAVESLYKVPAFDGCHQSEQVIYAPALFKLSDHYVLEAVRCTGHHNQAFYISAFGVYARCEHSSHAVSEDEDPVTVDTLVISEHCERQKSVLYRLLPYSHARRIGFHHFPPMHKSAFVVPDRGYAMRGKPVGQIFERRQFDDFLVHVAGS